MDPQSLLFGKLKKNKIENLCFLFSPNTDSNNGFRILKTIKTVHLYLNTPMNFFDICNIIIYFHSFTNTENVM